MNEIIQHIVFPGEGQRRECPELFVRGDAAFAEGPCIRLEAGQRADFATYLNGLSAGKWRKATRFSGAVLQLEFQGEAELCLTGYSLVQGEPVRKVLGTEKLSSPERTAVRVSVPADGETIFGFEVDAAGPFVLYGGFYEGEFPEDTAREIHLAVVTTTFRREEFIRRNMRLLKEGLMDLWPEAGSRITVHVVDNGRTLAAEDLPADPRFLLHPNVNAGGSGGYARGMMEALGQKPEATHFLLMDDDVEILPDSIFRTLALLRFAREEYRDAFVSGAMLTLEDKCLQYEDIGRIGKDGGFRAVKPELNQARIRDNLANEQEVSMEGLFQGWWYCVIPAATVRKYGLPLPLFIRGDDVEYSLRCGAKILSMNGICLWHAGFFRKFNASMDLYQRCRNLWVGKACTEGMRGIDAETYTGNEFRAMLLKYNYDSAELVLRALEDFLKGPGFFRENRGEEIARENAKLNDVLAPLETLRNVPGVPEALEELGGGLSGCLRDIPRKPVETLLFRLTCNGHRLWPEGWLKKEPAAVSFDRTYQPGKIALRKYHLMVNPYEGTGKMLAIDRRRYRELRGRYRAAERKYWAEKEALFRQYREAAKEFTGETFWREYLGL